MRPDDNTTTKIVAIFTFLRYNRGTSEEVRNE